MRITAKISVVIPAILLILLSCNKQNEWLDEPRKKEELTIKSVKDMQELLNNTTIFNTSMPAIGLIGCDNILVKDSELGRVNVIEKNAYLWTKDIYEGQISTDYFTAYKGIVYANVVLESLKNLKIESNDPASYRQISGQACFYRAYMYSELVNLFCKAYNSATANTDKGICIKRSSDVNQIVQRSSVLECYSQILEDATTASSLLGKTGLFTTQPTKLSAWGLLARVYLSMNNYEKSFQFADSVVKNNTQLIDFNTIPSLSLPFRFPNFKTGNSEVLFYGEGNGYVLIFPNEVPGYGGVDTAFYQLYDDNDLRKVYFFKRIDDSLIKFVGSYTGREKNFSGIAINEILLIRAECNVRLGRINEGLNDLNKLLSYRYKRGTYVEYLTSDANEALDMILQERRKELPFTGQIRWQDLRRLNLDPRLATSIQRRFGSVNLILAPNDPKYVYPFPQIEIDKAGIEQNFR